MVPEGSLGSSARTFSSAGCVVASGTNYELGDPPPFPSRSHDVASERAGVSELRRTPAKPSRRSKLPVANPIRPIGWARFRSWQKTPPLCCRAVSLQCRAASCQLVHQFVPGLGPGMGLWRAVDPHRGAAGRTASGGRAAVPGAQLAMTAHHRPFAQVVGLGAGAGTTRPSPSTVSRGLVDR